MAEVRSVKLKATCRNAAGLEYDLFGKLSLGSDGRTIVGGLLDDDEVIEGTLKESTLELKAVSNGSINFHYFD